MLYNTNPHSLRQPWTVEIDAWAEVRLCAERLGNLPKVPQHVSGRSAAGAGAPNPQCEPHPTPFLTSE